MAQASRKTIAEPTSSSKLIRHLQEVTLIVLGAIALFLLISLFSYSATDQGWSHTSDAELIRNKGGVVGAWLADVLLYLFGYLAYLFPLMIGWVGWMVYRARQKQMTLDYFHLSMRTVGFIFTIGMGCGIAWLHFTSGAGMPHDAGGILGDVIGEVISRVFGAVGGTLLMLSLFLTGITLFTGLSWLWLMDTTGLYTLKMMDKLATRWDEFKDSRQGEIARRERGDIVKEEKIKSQNRPKPRIEPVISSFEPSERVEKEKQKVLFDGSADTSLPPLNLLDPAKHSDRGFSRESLEAMSRVVELKLKDFGISADVVAVTPGPVITRFELQPAPGVKVSQINNLSKDLARSLSTVSVRVVDVIPGKSVIGLEIPNEYRELVTISEIFNSKEFDESQSPLTLVLGKDIAGKPVVADLAKMPHLLVAGTTGSGKSVALNAMIVSLLYKSTPADVRLIMIDPKMLELSVYEGIPSLLAPVVTDMKEAANALRWCVAEMERRYKLMAALGVRNITGYNRKVKDAIKAGTPILDPLYVAAGEPNPPELEPLPYIVVIIDELADMMMTVGKKVEELIARLAQKARAAGVHLILATQRPSVDVITGLIKANIPTRIAFQVSSRIDSRTILDQMGAENLLGHGDMLFLPPGTGLPVRVHGAFVSDQEVHKVASNLKEKGEPAYISAVLEGPQEGESDAMPGFESASTEDADPLYDQAVRIVTESRRASISGVQRRLKIGYNRAARMIEEMERTGVVGELQSNGSREVLAPPPPKD